MEHHHIILFSWEGPEFEKQEKTAFWDLGVICFGVILFIWGLIRGDVTLSALAILGPLCLWMLGKKEPKTIRFSLRSDGVQIGDLLYHYRSLESFWMFDESHSLNELLLRSKRFLTPLIHIHLGKQDAKEIRAILSKHLKEKEEPYPMSHLFAKMIGY